MICSKNTKVVQISLLKLLNKLCGFFGNVLQQRNFQDILNSLEYAFLSDYGGQLCDLCPLASLSIAFEKGQSLLVLV